MEPTDSFGRESVVRALDATETQVAGISPAAVAPCGPEKYSVDAAIGAGGMGRVLLVTDRDLRRQVAMKLMKPDLAIDRDHRLRFVAEAQATSQLEHPGIPPVHDMGCGPAGAPWFTMRLVRGRTLRAVLHDLLLNVRSAREEFTLHRLVTVLERVCETVHFAHERGVVHRDLKPDNVMLGEFGEVYVLDWGIARVSARDVDPADAVATDEADTGLRTMDGQIKGTPPYMSPEQASGWHSRVDRRTDVWAVGCILYEVLTLHLAFDGPDLLDRVRSARYEPVRTRNPRRVVPEDLAELCDGCLRRDARARPATARDLAASLRAWLDGTAEGERRRRSADDLVHRAGTALAESRRLGAEVLAAEDRSRGLADRTRPWDPVQSMRPVLEARREVERLRTEQAQALHDGIALLEGALHADGRHAAARRALAEVWRTRLAEAEASFRAEDAAQALRMLQRYDDGELLPTVRGDAVFRLASEPPGAEVFIARLDEADGLRIPAGERRLGITPIERQTLPMGSYLCTLRLGGFRDVRYPVLLTRGRSFQGHVRMRTDAEIGEDFVYVPRGPCVLGEGAEARTAELPDFAMARRPVTFGEWSVFLDAVEREHGAAASERLLPRTATAGPLLRRDAGGYRVLTDALGGGVPGRRPWVDDAPTGARLPVVGVSWFDAVEYCQWRTRIDGRRRSLPTEDEFEKAARGVDGRRFPWGDLEHGSLANCAWSREGDRGLAPVGTYATATSIYGVEDAAGNAWTWTNSWFDAQRTLRVVRGGGWNSRPANLRCARRNSNAPEDRFAYFGFRVVCAMR